MKHFIFALLFLFSNFLPTQLPAQTYVERQAVQGSNLLRNAGFENLTSQWILGAGVSAGPDLANFIDGRGLALTLTSVNGTVISNSVPCSHLNGLDLEHSIFLKTSLTTLQVCALHAGAEVGDCLAVRSTNKMHQVIFPATFAPATGTCGIKVKTASSTSGTVTVDSGYVGLSRATGKFSPVAEMPIKVGWGSYNAAAGWNDNGGTGTVAFGDASMYNDTTKLITLTKPGRYEAIAHVLFPAASVSTAVGFKLNGSGPISSSVVYGSPNGDSGGRIAHVSFEVGASPTTIRPMQYINGTTLNNLSAFMTIKYYPPTSEANVVSATAPANPTFTRLTTVGSSSIVPPAGATYAIARFIGGGGGGGGSGTTLPSAGGAGSASVIGGGTAGGGFGAGNFAGGNGGVCNLDFTGANARNSLIRAAYGGGGGGFSVKGTGSDWSAGIGGAGWYGGAGTTIAGATAGVGGLAAGAGGSGAGLASGTNGTLGTGGGGACYIEILMPGPLPSSIPYTVGGGGVGSSGTTSGFKGGDGFRGEILIEWYYGGQANVAINSKAPTVYKFTSGSGNFDVPAGAKYLEVKMVGGGSGGYAGGAGAAGGNGGATTFGTSLLSAFGGATINGGGYGITSPAYGSGFYGGNGNSGLSAGSDALPGGAGGSSCFGGAGTGTPFTNAGQGAQVNSGSGGGGGGNNAGVTSLTGYGGGAGGCVFAIIPGPLNASYPYSVGTGGAGAPAAGNGKAGGPGAAGYLEITVHYY